MYWILARTMTAIQKWDTSFNMMKKGLLYWSEVKRKSITTILWNWLLVIEKNIKNLHLWKHLLENYKLNEWHFQKTSLPTSSLVPSGTPKQPIDLRMTETPYSYVHYVTLQNQFIRNVPFRSQTPCPKMDPSAMLCPLALAFLSGLLKDIHTMHCTAIEIV